MSTGLAATRPWYLTFIGVLGVIQGILTALGGIALVVERNDRDFIDHVDVSSDTISCSPTRESSAGTASG